ncbi:MAG: hypothetical protein IPL71_22995 [Anaerolineales bacterium]|uniref:hypothetical protein n=1 Tax=Candidatus Villigracilis proximus TaxID=3140683 RepID=UPI003135CF3B|nr:hypothetical protein [Anaerolineales bacterium]
MGEVNLSQSENCPLAGNSRPAIIRKRGGLFRCPMCRANKWFRPAQRKMKCREKRFAFSGFENVSYFEHFKILQSREGAVFDGKNRKRGGASAESLLPSPDRN